jgi:hypothetical protein
MLSYRFDRKNARQSGIYESCEDKICSTCPSRDFTCKKKCMRDKQTAITNCCKEECKMADIQKMPPNLTDERKKQFEENRKKYITFCQKSCEPSFIWF